MQLKVFISSGLVATLLSLVSGQPPDCKLTDPTSLSTCIKTLLIGSRDKIKRNFDPLRFNNIQNGGLQVSDIAVRGISSFNVDNLSVSFPKPSQIAVRASISWPWVVGSLYVEVHGCRRFIFKICATVLRARPEIAVAKPSGTLTTTLNVKISPQGQVFTTASDTNVDLDLSSVRIKVNFGGIAGFLNRLSGDTVSKVLSRVTNKWWSSNKGIVEMKAREALNQVVENELSKKLGKVLKIGSVSVPVADAPAGM